MQTRGVPTCEVLEILTTRTVHFFKSKANCIFNATQAGVVERSTPSAWMPSIFEFESRSISTSALFSLMPKLLLRAMCESYVLPKLKNSRMGLGITNKIFSMQYVLWLISFIHPVFFQFPENWKNIFLQILETSKTSYV